MAALLCAGCDKKPSTPSGASTPSIFTVRALTAERSGDHLHLTVTVTVKNSGPAPLILAPPAAPLWIGRDKPAVPFIAPGIEPPVITAGTESEVTTHWWLAGSDLSGTLELEIAGARQTVKSAEPFVLTSLIEGQATPLAFPVWKATSSQ